MALSLRLSPNLTSKLSVSLVISIFVTGFTAAVTVISLLAVTPLPSFAAAVIVVVPGFNTFTVPSWFMVATCLLLLLHVTLLSVALSGLTLALSLRLPPNCTSKLPVSLFISIDFTGTTALLIFISNSFFVPLPSAAVAVIVTFPSFNAVTFPVFWSTVAISVLLLDQVTVLFEASSGFTVAVSICSPFTVILDEPFMVMLLTFTFSAALATVTLHAAVFPPSAVVTVIVASPALTALTLPSASTVATEGSLDFQLTALYVASEGVIVAVSLSVSFGFISAVVLLSSTFVTAFVNVTFPLPLVFSTVPLPSTVILVFAAISFTLPFTVTLLSLADVDVESLATSAPLSMVSLLVFV